MTCIAYRRGTLAADTRISYGDIHNGEREKISRCGIYWAAIAGSAWVKTYVEEWVTNGCKPSEYPKVLRKSEREFSVLLMDDFGICYDLCSGGHILPIPGSYAAIGSGSEFALGAMAVGAPAIAAVEAACKHDKASGGKITHVIAPFPSVTMPIDAAVTGRASHLLPN